MVRTYKFKMNFAQLKTRRLETDLSKKGSIDSEIIDLVKFINNQDNLCTTSSCSGRIAIFSEDTESCKKGCQWLYISHKPAEFEQVKSSLCDSPICGAAVFKYEPFVLHVQCRSIDDAKLIHQVSVASGFRNSGITIGKNGKIMAAVRSTHGLEVPLADSGMILVPFEYLSYLVNVANSKLEENSRRIERFFSNLQSAVRKQTELCMAVKQTDSSKRKANSKEYDSSRHRVTHRTVQCTLIGSTIGESRWCDNSMSTTCEQIGGTIQDGSVSNVKEQRCSSIAMDVLDDLQSCLTFLEVDS